MPYQAMQGNQTVSYIIYMLECQNGNFYTGYTTDLTRRYQEHCKGSPKCKYTRSFPPKRIAASWQVHDLSLALKVEKAIKCCSKVEKLEIARHPSHLHKRLLVMGWTPEIVNEIELNRLNEKDDLSTNEFKAFKSVANIFLTMTKSQFKIAIKNGDFVEL